MAPRPFPILFITATRIGDAVLSSGLIHKLANEIPGARFTIVAGPLAAPLFANTPGLDQVIVMAKAKGGGHWFALWNQVRKTRWGLIVDLRGSAISTFLNRQRRAVKRKVPGPRSHKVVEAASVLKLDEPAAPFLYTTPQIEAQADELTMGGGAILAMGPASNWVGKVWPIERFAQAAKRLLESDGPLSGGRLMILGGPEDVRLVDELRRALPKEKLIDLVGQVDLLTAYACLKRANLFIGNDSGLMHLAAAAGIPTLGLFGPSDERLYAPWGPKARPVRGPRSLEQFLEVDPDLSQTIRHMSDLPVATVVTAAIDLLAELQSEKSDA
jgi:ADP-heptose:LPS heptosyltransferase